MDWTTDCGCWFDCWFDMVLLWPALVVPFHKEGFRPPRATEIQAEKVIVAYPILFQVSTSQQSLKMKMRYLYLMKFLYLVLIVSLVLAVLVTLVSYLLNGPAIMVLFPVFLLVFVPSCVGSAYGLRWWYRSIMKDLQRQQQQKPKQKK